LRVSESFSVSFLYPLSFVLSAAFSERESARGDGEYTKVFGLLIDDGVARKCAAIGCDEERHANSQILKAMMNDLNCLFKLLSAKDD
jgi:hypothetical protein